MSRFSDFFSAAPISDGMFSSEPMSALSNGDWPLTWREEGAVPPPEWQDIQMRVKSHVKKMREHKEASMRRALEEFAQKRPYEIELYGLFDDVPAKSSKFPLPTISASEAQAFQLFVRKAKPLKRAMVTLKNATTALRAGDARVAIDLSVRAAVLAGRGSQAVPKLAARIMRAAIDTAKQAIGQQAAVAGYWD